MAEANAAHHDEAHGHPTGWRRYVYSTNHKDIGTMYLIFAIVAGIIGGILSGFMRAELAEPGIQIFTGLAQMVYGDRGRGRARRRQADVQRVHHRARPDHDLLHGHAGHDRRFRQLVRAADDRGARHGLPAHEQHLVLAVAAGLPASGHLDVRFRHVRVCPASAAAGPSIRRSRPPTRPARPWISPSWRCTSPARPRSSARSTSSPRSSTCARRA